MSSKNIFHGNGNRRRFSGRISEQGSCGGGDNSSAIRLGYQRRTRNTHGQRPKRTAPNTPADSGGPAPQDRAAVPGNLPRPVPILMRSQHRCHSKSDWLIPRKECPVRPGWRLGRIVRANSSLDQGRHPPVGREDVGWPQAKPVIHWDSVTLIPICPPTHRRMATCFCDHRGRNSGGAAGVPSKRQDAWAVPNPSFGVVAPLDSWGRRAGWPVAAPVRLLAHRPPRGSVA